MIRSTLRAAALACLAAAAAPAFAQDVVEPADDGSDNFTIGIGAVYGPSYEGSDDYVVSPAAQVRGRVSGFSVFTRGTSLYLDLIREAPGAPVDVSFGPVVNLRLNRTGRIKDPQVRALGELDTAVEAGASLGVTKNGVLHDYDFLTGRVDVIHDVTDTHDGLIVTPAIEYATPLSRTFLVGASLSAEHVAGKFARTYFGVTPAGAAGLCSRSAAIPACSAISSDPRSSGMRAMPTNSSSARASATPSDRLSSKSVRFRN